MRFALLVPSPLLAAVFFLPLACGGQTSSPSPPAPDAPPAVLPDASPPSDAPDASPVSCEPSDSTAAPEQPCAASSLSCATLPPIAPASCTPLGTVHFHLSCPNGCDVTPYVWGMDTVTWFSVSTASGESVAILPPTAGDGAYTWAPSCCDCQPLVTAVGQTLEPVDDGGIDGVWSGTSFGAATTCNAQGIGVTACGTGSIACASAGSYVVKMCTSAPQGTPQCVSVPFAFPGTGEVVEGTIVTGEDGG